MRRHRAVVASALLVAGLVSCGPDGVDTVELYDRAPVPFVPDRTEPIAVAEEPLADGLYWAELLAPTSPTVLTFDLTQAFFAAACEEEFGVANCAQGFAVVAENQRSVDAIAAELVAASVVGRDRQNYAITGDELLLLAAGTTASEPAPDSYSYQPYPFLVTVVDGVPTEAAQIWLAPPP